MKLKKKRFLDKMSFYSVSCGLSAAPAPTGTGTYRHRPALTELNRHKTGTDRPGLFYDVVILILF
jgi:hypothetical protein